MRPHKADTNVQSSSLAETWVALSLSLWYNVHGYCDRGRGPKGDLSYD